MQKILLNEKEKKVVSTKNVKYKTTPSSSEVFKSETKSKKGQKYKGEKHKKVVSTKNANSTK